MKVHWNLSLRGKLMLAIIASQLIVVSFCAYPVLRGRYRIIEEQMKESVLSHVNGLTSTFSEAFTDSDFEALEKSLQRASQNPKILYLLVEDDKGRLLASFSSGIHLPEESSVTGEEAQSLGRFTRQKSHWDVVNSIIIGGELKGRVRAGISTEEMDSRIAETTRTTAQLVALAMVIGSVIAAGLSWRLTKALNTLIEEAQRMAQGDMTHHVEVATGDELETLGEAFNLMAKNLKASREELEQTHRDQMMRADRLATIGELASGIAHEIRNPLAGISGAMQVLATEFGEGTPKQQIIQEILRQVERMNRTMQDILDYSRPALPLVEPCNLNGLLEEVLFFLSTSHVMDGIKVEKHFHPFLPEIEVDPKQIYQVFLNILLNALQAMSQEGTLTIRTDVKKEEGKEGVHIEIRDTGIGMSVECQRRIFKPFFTTKPQGTGLGLPIALRIIEQHQGIIACHSKLEEGSCFCLWLPLEKEKT
ncbi:MAG: HAMP domain-containing protein [Candidatus Tectomicrobia bacterium]|nr:HAMP domain-containing protein [Candidatus Tectomicrobia bacterium]